MEKNDISELSFPDWGTMNMPPPQLSNDRFVEWIANEIHWLREDGKLDKLLAIPEPLGEPFSL